MFEDGAVDGNEPKKSASDNVGPPDFFWNTWAHGVGVKARGRSHQAQSTPLNLSYNSHSTTMTNWMRIRLIPSLWTFFTKLPQFMGSICLSSTHVFTGCTSTDGYAVLNTGDRLVTWGRRRCRRLTGPPSHWRAGAAVQHDEHGAHPNFRAVRL